MQSNVKLTLLAAVGAAIFAAGPAAAQQTSRHSGRAITIYRTDPMATNAADLTVVTVDGNYIGRDPDPQIRSELLKNQADHEGNTY